MKEQPHFNPRKARADFRGLRGWSFQILWLRFQWTWQNLRIIWQLRVGDGLVPGPEIVFLNKLLVAVLFFKWNFKVGNKLDYLLYWHLKQAPWVAGCFWSFGSLFTLGDFFFFIMCDVLSWAKGDPTKFICHSRRLQSEDNESLYLAKVRSPVTETPGPLGARCV